MFEIPKLKFPKWETLKDMPRNEEIILILFAFDSIMVHGRITLFEDGGNRIFFDVMERGYSNQNNLGLSKPFTKKGYAEICSHAQTAYEKLVRELLRDCSWMWQSELSE